MLKLELQFKQAQGRAVIDLLDKFYASGEIVNYTIHTVEVGKFKVNIDFKNELALWRVAEEWGKLNARG